MMQLNNDYQRDDLLKFLEEDFLIDFRRDIRPVNTSSLSCIQKAQYLGESRELDLQVFEFVFDGSSNKRVALTKDAFSVMRSSAIYNALAVFHSPDNKDWRFSLLTATPEPTEKGKVSLTYSNPKRLSFFLGQNAKINTPTKFLISKGKVTDFDDLKSRFSIEVVNKEFYKEISQAFTKLVSGQLKLPSTQDKSKTNLEFAVRLIGRIIFCWFLREKKSETGLSLMPKDLLSISAVQKNKDYYHRILEPIFFEVLNKQVKSRREDFAKEPFSSVPYLNGGLFSPQEDDFYKRMNGDLQSQFHNTLVIPDSWLNDFFEILETYNFTIDENTSYDEELSIDPEMLGRIFENLLAEINPETGESARKSTGSYYTPRSIVNYMVDESLLLYLKEQTGISEEKLRAIISYDLSDDSENPVTLEEKEKIIGALEKVKILDPACGSGAFPIGALQKIVFILQQTDPEGQLWFKKQIKNTSPEVKRVIEREFENKNFDYIRKLGIIRENIYGVDIQSIATEISRLRCFLTLIVDERIEDKHENRGIEPLPNLDFKFVTANSLIGLPKIDLSQQSMFDDYQKIDDLKNIRDQYFNASGIEREQLKTEFVTQQKRLVDQLIKEHGFMGVAKAELTQKLTDWEPFTHKSTSWFDPEWMFGIKDGFDIVIANPPYISHVNYKYDDKPVLRKIYSTYSGRADVYVIFYERAIKLANIHGVISYITPNKFFRAGYGAKIRQLFHSDIQVISIVDFGDTPVFDATTYPAVLILKNTPPENYTFSYLKAKNLNGFNLRGKIQNFPRDYLTQQLWSFEEDELAEIWKKIRQNSQSLKQYINDKFYRGIVTGLNEAFLITEEERSSILKDNPEASEIIKPYLRGKDVKRWLSKPSNYIIFTYHGVDISKYPAVEKYLASYRKQLENRATSKNHKWYELQQPQTGIFRHYEEIKIISTDIAKRCEFTIDTTGAYIDATLFCIPLKDFYLLALLNSKLLELFYKSISSTIRGDFLRFKKIYLDLLPIKVPSESERFYLSNIATKILEISKNQENIDQVKIFEKQIDNSVYKLYGLTKEEIDLVDNYA